MTKTETQFVSLTDQADQLRDQIKEMIEYINEHGYSPMFKAYSTHFIHEEYNVIIRDSNPVWNTLLNSIGRSKTDTRYWLAQAACEVVNAALPVARVFEGLTNDQGSVLAKGRDHLRAASLALMYLRDHVSNEIAQLDAKIQKLDSVVH